MPRIVNLDDLVPDDIVFVHEGNEYAVPGDLDTETALRLLSFMEPLENIAPDGTDPDEAQRLIDQHNKAIERVLLEIFQRRQPHLDRLPFGKVATQHVLLQLLISCGFEFTPGTDGDSDGDGEDGEVVPTGPDETSTPSGSSGTS